MGNYRFKLSDMMPNAWFYKLRDIGRARKQTPTTHSRKKKQASPASTKHSSKPNQPHQCINPRKSYYFTRDLNLNQKALNTNFPEPPRKSSKQRAKRRTATRTSSSSSPLHSSAESEFPDPEFRTDRVLPTNSSFDEMVSISVSNSSCGCRLHPKTNDIIINVDNNSIARKDDDNKLDGYDSFSELALPPIVTKPTKFNEFLSDDDGDHGKNNKKETKPRSRMAANKEHNVEGSLKVKILKEDTASMKEVRTNHGGRRLRLRINSPRIGSRKIQAHSRKSVSSATGRRSLSDSFAMVKSSFNPQRDFRESMVEMILQNNIRTSKDLEDLLACYLSLNSDEYHDLIIKVFKQIWFDLTDNR